MTHTHYTIPLYAGEKHFIDLSFLLDAPAGKHGFLKVVNGRLIFEDQSSIRFWGVNLVAGDCFPDKADAPKIAKRLAIMGCNLVRLHHIDAPWAHPNIFGTDNHSLTLHRDSLDKLDYLVYCLKQKGIYIFIDLLVHRKFGRTEGFEEDEVLLGGKQAAFFDKSLISLQKIFIEQLLTHHNIYTDLTYAKDPVLIACLIINEACIFTTTTGSYLSLEHEKALKSHMLNPHKNRITKYQVDYTQPGGGYYPEKGNDTYQEFLIGLENTYYKEMYQFLKENIGFEALILGSNFPFPMLSNIYTNSQLDAMAVNVYWDHPDLSTVNNDWNRVEEASILNRSILKQQHYYYNSLIHLATRFKIKDKPLVITEWNACKPNEYILEAMPYMAAYARLQAWDMCCIYNLQNCLEAQTGFSSFDIAHRPDLLAMWTLATLLFSTNYLAESETVLTQQWNKKEFLKAPNRDPLIDQAPLIPFHTRLQHEFVEGNALKINPQHYQSLPLPEGNPLIIDFEQGKLELRSPYAQGIIGCFNDKEYDFPFFKLKIENNFAAVVAISLDGKALMKKCERLLLIAVTQTKEDHKTNTLEVEEMKGYVIFKHDLCSKRILPRPCYLHKENSSEHVKLQLEPTGMMMNLSSQNMTSDQTSELLEGTFLYEICIEY